mmetsp:Transcript_39110/g.112419  ORF Transcript_39110/g.112419 Transcript_39110/m.112419 type:complete len:200 (-) Transcript_39110:1207-1806(-)
MLFEQAHVDQGEQYGNDQAYDKFLPMPEHRQVAVQQYLPKVSVQRVRGPFHPAAIDGLAEVAVADRETEDFGGVVGDVVQHPRAICVVDRALVHRIPAVGALVDADGVVRVHLSIPRQAKKQEWLTSVVGPIARQARVVAEPTYPAAQTRLVRHPSDVGQDDACQREGRAPPYVRHVPLDRRRRATLVVRHRRRHHVLR